MSCHRLTSQLKCHTSSSRSLPDVPHPTPPISITSPCFILFMAFSTILTFPVSLSFACLTLSPQLHSELCSCTPALAQSIEKLFKKHVLRSLPGKMVEHKDLSSSPLMKTPKSQPAAEQPLTKRDRNLPKDILLPKTKKKPQRDGGRHQKQEEL